MAKTILITGSTDGIGLATAEMLVKMDHNVLIHGRNPQKLDRAKSQLSALNRNGHIKGFVADLTRMKDVETLAQEIIESQDSLDVLINNAGIFRTADPITKDGHDVRFLVNAIAPYLLTRRLLPSLGSAGRVINLSSAAQAPVDTRALTGRLKLSDDFAAYAQSKLALTMWSRHLALALDDEGPAIIAVNPGSMLGSKMVKEAFGVAGGDIRIGADVLARAALSDEFGSASGEYFDNDSGKFASPHPDALDSEKSEEVMRAIAAVLADIAPSSVEESQATSL